MELSTAGLVGADGITLNQRRCTVNGLMSILEKKKLAIFISYTQLRTLRETWAPSSDALSMEV